MPIKIMTDSVADIKPELADELGITVIPLLLRFGDEVYRDGVDITADEFYKKLATSKVLPVTSVPTPTTFSNAYDRLAKDADRIIVITLGSGLSGTYEIARQAVGLMKRKCWVEVIDSRLATMAEGFVVVEAAKAAGDGAGYDEVMDIIKRSLERVDFRASLSTLDHLRRGGRIGRAQALMGSMLRINPILTLKDGLVMPVTRTHSRSRAIDYLYKFVTSFSKIDGLAVESSGKSADADKLVGRLSGVYPLKKIYRSTMTPVIGAHAGPGLVMVAVLGDK